MGSVWLAGRMEPWTILLGGVLLLGAGYRLHRRSQTRRDRTVVRWAQDPRRYTPRPADWPLAASAMWTLDRSPWDEARLDPDWAREELESVWEITDTQGLRDHVDWLRFSGHRVAALRDDFTEVSFHAFDWLRLIMLARAGVTVGLISQEEMQVAFADAQTALQARYHSWEEMGEAWAMGYAQHLADYSDIPMTEYLNRIRAQNQMLLTAPRGPWARVPRR